MKLKIKGGGILETIEDIIRFLVELCLLPLSVAKYILRDLEINIEVGNKKKEKK